MRKVSDRKKRNGVCEKSPSTTCPAVSRDHSAGGKVELTLQTVLCQLRPNSGFLKKHGNLLSGKGQLHLGAITQIRRPQ